MGLEGESDWSRAQLHYRVVEPRYNTFEGAVGFQGDAGVVGLANLDLGNLAGTGREVGLHWSSRGSGISDFSARYVEPLLFGAPMRVEAAILQEVYDTLYVRTRGGARLQFAVTSQDKVEVAYLEKKDFQYLYQEGDDYVFMDTETYDQYPLPKDLLGDQMKYLKENDTVKLTMYEGKPIDIELPATVELKVVETEPSVKGATAAAQFKPAVMETGLKITVPPFIGVGEVLQIDTRTGEYLSRAK